MKMRSGGGVLCISALELMVGLCILGIFEGYKTHYFNGQYTQDQKASAAGTSITVRNMTFRSPIDFLFYFAIVNNIFAVLGFAGVLHGQKELVTAFFVYNSVQMVVSFHYFVDVCADVGIRYSGVPTGLTAYEQAAAAFVFFHFLLSISATVFALKAIEEIRGKQREEYNRLSVLSDTLQYDMDQA